MKKKIVALLVCSVMAVSCFTGCGKDAEVKEETKTEATAEVEKEEAPAETEEAEVEEDVEEEAEEDVEESDVEEEGDTADAEETEGFSLLDVDASMINCGYYAVEENGEEVVFSLFTAPSGTPYCALFVYNQDQAAGDYYVGDYSNGSSTAKDEEGIDWTYITFPDEYTGNTVELAIVEADDGSAVIVAPDDTQYNCTALSAEDTITYMGSAIAVIDGSQE